MNNTEKFTRLRRLFKEYEALTEEKNEKIYEIQKLSIPGGIKENCIKEYKAFVNPKIEKVADDIMRIINSEATTFVLDRTAAIRYCPKKNDPLKDKTYYEFDFGTWSIAIDSDVFIKAHNDCYNTDKDCTGCAINDLMDQIPFMCGPLEEKYLRGEYRIIHGKEENTNEGNN